MGKSPRYSSGGGRCTRLGPPTQLGGHHAAQYDCHFFGVIWVMVLEFIGHLRERAVSILVELCADGFAGGIQVNLLHIAVPHRAPPRTDSWLVQDSSARSMADASSTSRADVVKPVHR
jgi:hypothetical protein